jgi:hypothetical protein
MDEVSVVEFGRPARVPAQGSAQSPAQDTARAVAAMR